MSTKSFGTDLVMNNLAEVRALQNRAATLVCACELPEDLKEVLDEAGLALHQQIYANHLVDKVVWKECQTSSCKIAGGQNISTKNCNIFRR